MIRSDGSWSTFMLVVHVEVPSSLKLFGAVLLWRVGGVFMASFLRVWGLEVEGWISSVSYATSLEKSSYVCRVSGSWSMVRAQAIFYVMRPVSPLVWYTLGMGTVKIVFWVRGFGKGLRKMLRQ